jgi:integrase
VVTVRRAYAKGRLTTYSKTVRLRRRVPFRSRVVVALEQLPRRRGILFPALGGGRIDINSWIGTSVLMIDRTYGDLAHDAEEHDWRVLEAFDATDRARGHVVGTEGSEDEQSDAAVP